MSSTVWRATSSIVSNVARARRVVLRAQAPESGVHEDHVDRVARGVVQVAGDPGAFLGRGEAALAFGFPFGPQRALLQLGHPLAPEPCAVAGKPGPAPHDDAERDRRAREVAVLESHRGDVRGQQCDGERERDPQLGARCVGAGGQEVQRDGRPERRAGGFGDDAQRDAGDTREDEHAQRGRAPRDERQRRQRRQQHGGRSEAVVFAGGQQHERQREHGDGERGVAEHFGVRRAWGGM